MNEEQMRLIMFVAVDKACEDLTDEELAVLNLVVQSGQSPRNRIFDYEKVKHLFDANEKAHDEVKLALARVVVRRLGSQ